VDKHGRFFGLHKGTECIFKPAVAEPKVLGPPSVTWATAKPCVKQPTAESATADSAGLLWGWEDDDSCAFRPNTQQQQQQQQQQQYVRWEDAPVCSFAPTQGSVEWDDKEHGWGQENGLRCAFRVSLGQN
jgi:hypothetical protein